MNIIWFDFDGTIIHVDERFYRVHIAICDKLEISPLSKEDYWNARCNGTSTENILKLLNAPHLFEQYISLRNILLESLGFLKYDKLRGGVKDVLDELSIIYRLNLLTGRSNRDNLLLQLENLGIKKYFNNIFMVSPFSRWEEKSAILSKSSNESDFMIGDTPNDIVAAKNAGVKTIGILNGMSTVFLISASNPDFIIDDFIKIKNII